MTAKAAPAPAIAAACAASTSAWQADLKRLFDCAKERFPDVVWELIEDEDDTPELVWGHKGDRTISNKASFVNSPRQRL